MKTVFGGNCFCDSDVPPSHVESVFDCNLSAVCGEVGEDERVCGEGTPDYHTCTNFFVASCGSTSPTPTPTPATICDEAERPNPTNCTCIPASAGLPAHWNCRCDLDENGTAAAYGVYPSNAGCPPGTFDNGNDCCVCDTPSGACPPPTPTPPDTECPPADTAPCRADEEAPDPDAGPTRPHGCDYSPVLVDLRGDGVALTGAAHGVLFDFNGDGVRSRFSWTAAGSDDAWLALDRDGDGRVGDASELFGDFTPPPPPPPGERRNGFLALAE